MKPASMLILASLLLAGPSLALEKEEIEAIAAKPHSREGLLPALKIFSDAREYEVEVVTETPELGQPIVFRQRRDDGRPGWRR